MKTKMVAMHFFCLIMYGRFSLNQCINMVEQKKFRKFQCRQGIR